MITSLDNRQVKDLVRLHQKKYREDRFLILDEDLIGLTHEKDKLLQLIYAGEMPFTFENALEVSQEVLNKIAQKEGLRYIGVSRMIDESDEYGNRVIMLDRLQDPLNIGRIMEAALLFGFDTLILSEDCADIYNEKCLDNCKGGIYRLHIRHANLKEEIRKLKEMDYAVYATGLQHDTKELYEINESERMAFILGNEGSGVDQRLMEMSDETLKIDMCNIDSLNVGMAAAIIMYRFRI